jgi:hypothetical protein
VTDEIDRRVLAGYLNQYFCEDCLAVPNYPLSSLKARRCRLTLCTYESMNL